MQRSLFIAAARLTAVAAVLTFVSCKKEQAPAETEIPGKDETVPQEVIRHFHNAGFDTSIKVISKNGRFIVEGDIVFPQEKIFADIKKRKTEGSENQRFSYQSIIPGDANSNIKVVVTGSTLRSAAWLYSIRTAIGRWNMLMGCRINFILDETRSPDGVWEDLVISESSLGGPLGQGSWPDGTVGNNLYIDVNAVAGMGSAWGDYSGKRIFLVMHELGHTVGMRHSDLNATDNLIPGTPNSDAWSVMNSGGNNMEHDHFSEYDRVAASYMYPVTVNSIIANRIFGPSVVPYGGPYYEHYAAAVYGENFYTWSLLDANQQHLHTFNEEEQDNRALAWFLTVNGSPLPRGQYYLRCTVSNADYPGSPALFPLTIQ